MMKKDLSRRGFIQKSFFGGISLAALNYLPACNPINNPEMKFGLVTWQWGRDWDLPTLISNLEKTGYAAVELRTEHAHAVETNLSAAQRAEVKKRFDDSPVTCVGYGSNWSYHFADKAVLRHHIEQSKEYVILCRDIGATGLKVKPDTLPADVPAERTIAQIAASLNEVGKFASDFGQLIRVEVHGRHTQELPNMKAIFDQVTEPNVRICWNCNQTDLNPPGLEYNFNLVREWMGDVVHVHELEIPNYPYQQLFNIFAGMNYGGWILLEASSTPPDRIIAMKEQLAIFNQMIANTKST
jgi:sugar phosphate isomerase/epimerase